MSDARTLPVTTIAAVSGRRVRIVIGAVAGTPEPRRAGRARACSARRARTRRRRRSPRCRARCSPTTSRGKLQAYEGDWDAAADALTEAAAAAPDQPMIAVELARLQMKARRTSRRDRDPVARPRARGPTIPRSGWRRATCSRAGDPGEAGRAYLRAIQLAPDDERAYLGLARLQRAEAAEATLRILIAHVPASVDGHYRLAVRLALRGELASSTRELRAVLERDPDHIDARLDLARALRRQGHLDQAIAETRSAFDRSGQALDIAEELFDLLCEADDRAAAIDLLTLLDDDHSDADALAACSRGSTAGSAGSPRPAAIAGRIGALDRDAGAIALAQVEIAAGNRAAALGALATVDTDGKLAGEARRLTAEAALAADDPAAALAVLGGSAAGAAPGPAMPRARSSTPPWSPRSRSPISAGSPRPAPGSPGSAPDPTPPTATPPSSPAPGSPTAPGTPAGALAILEPLIRARPDLVAALNLAGYLLADAGQRLDDAERYLRHARELSPGDPGDPR